MGQIVFNGQRPKYCNLTAITTGSKKDYPIPGGEIWLIDSTNTSKADGTGKYDYYIKGDGSKTASQLAENKIKIDDNDEIDIDSIPTRGSVNAVSSGGVYQALQDIDVTSQISGKEDNSNKITSFSSPTDIQYPSAKLVSDQLATKQDTIEDLDEIRSGAASGATAIQSLTVGTTTTGAAGTDASVINIGTATVPILNFTIPQGAQGIQGIQGPQGERGLPGESGVTGDVSSFTVREVIDSSTTYGATDIAGAAALQATNTEITELAENVDSAISIEGGIYDISLSTNEIYEDLLSALQDVPVAKRRGGISVRFQKLTPATYNLVFNDYGSKLTEDEQSAISSATAIESMFNASNGVFRATRITSGYEGNDKATIDSAINALRLNSSLMFTTTYTTEETVEEETVQVTNYVLYTITKVTDNITEYVQYRNLSSTWNTIEENWQGVDTDLLPRSNNLITNDAICKELGYDEFTIQIYPLITINKRLRASDGKMVTYSGKYYVSDFMLLKKGETLIIKNAKETLSYAYIAFYSDGSEYSFLYSIEGAGASSLKTYTYTATNDIYFRIGDNWTSNKPKITISKIIRRKRDTAIYSEAHTLLTADIYSEIYNIYTNGADDSCGRYFKQRAQSRQAVVSLNGIKSIKIVANPNSTHRTQIDLLNSIPSTANNAKLDRSLNYSIAIAAGDTFILDVDEHKYMCVTWSTDQRPIILPTFYIEKTNERDAIIEQDYAMFEELQPINIPLTVGQYAFSDYIDVSEGYKVSYKLYVTSSRACYFYDENYVVIGVWAFHSPEGTHSGESVFPPNTKYIRYRIKLISSTSYYIKIHRRARPSINDLSIRINDIAQLAANGGYRYMADSYDILTSNTDNTEALQTLVDKVNYDGGGIIELPRGTFNVAGQIKWASNVGLVGQGQNITIIKNTKTSGSIEGTFYGDYVNNVMFKDFTIDATESTTGKGMFMRYIEDGVFENLRIVGTIPTGLGIDFINRVKILNCNIYGCGRGRWSVITSGVGCSGIGIGTGWANHQENFIISNCVCDGNYNNGIFVEDQKRFSSGTMADGSGQVISNNICRNGRNCGIAIWGGRKVSITGNISYNNAGAGFEIGFYAVDGTFIGNQSLNNGSGFKIASITQPSSHIVFANNEVKGNSNGITIATNGNTNYIAIKGNELYNNSVGVKVTGNSTGLVVAENNEYGSSSQSFNLAGEHTNAVIRGNTYFTAASNSATFAGDTTFVEQFNS